MTCEFTCGLRMVWMREGGEGDEGRGEGDEGRGEEGAIKRAIILSSISHLSNSIYHFENCKREKKKKKKERKIFINIYIKTEMNIQPFQIDPPRFILMWRYVWNFFVIKKGIDNLHLQWHW
jgi:hypothetical protein